VILAAILLSQVGDVFVAGQDGYHPYRIPSALTTSKDTVLAFCEGPGPTPAGVRVTPE
jgi:hypothetical protein